MRIGILEDNQALARILQLSLELTGHKVHNTETIKDFLVVVLSPIVVELIIVDFRLFSEPSGVGLTGADVIRFVRRTYPDLPAILTSAAPLPRLHVGIEGLSRVKILQKPFRVAHLLETIKVLTSEEMKRGEKWQN